MTKLAIILISLVIFCIFIALYYSKKDTKRTQIAIGKIVKINPVFKATNKIDFEYNFEGTYFRGFTLANESAGYILNEKYQIALDPLNPKDAKLTSIKSN